MSVPESVSGRERTKQTFVIRHVADFTDVPEDLMDDCLREFAIAVRMAKFVRIILEETCEGRVNWKPMESFDWTDDEGDRYEVTLNVPTPDGGTRTAGRIWFDKGEPHYEVYPEPSPTDTPAKAAVPPSDSSTQKDPING